MWKLAILLVIAAVFSSASAQEPIALNCTFDLNFRDEYVCALTDIEVLDASREIIFVGEHWENKTNGDVEVVEITNSSTPFMIQQIFTTFPNIVKFDIQNSRLKSINIPDNIQLTQLYILGNNIPRIVNGTFRTQTRLQYLYVVESGVQEIEEDAFVGLESLLTLNLIRNNISELKPRTLSPMISATWFDFDKNNLTRIDDLFSSNTNLTYLHLENNQINEISPRFIANLGDSLDLVNLKDNRCVHQSFLLREEFDLILLHNALNPCYANFNGVVSETRHVTLEFKGSLALFDEFGNIVVRVN